MHITQCMRPHQLLCTRASKFFGTFPSKVFRRISPSTFLMNIFFETFPPKASNKISIMLPLIPRRNLKNGLLQQHLTAGRNNGNWMIRSPVLSIAGSHNSKRHPLGTLEWHLNNHHRPPLRVDLLYAAGVKRHVHEWHLGNPACHACRQAVETPHQSIREDDSHLSLNNLLELTIEAVSASPLRHRSLEALCP